MSADPTRRDRLKPEGLVVAGVGFLLTRYTVAAAVAVWRSTLAGEPSSRWSPPAA